MPFLTDEQFAASSRLLALSLARSCESRGIPADEAAGVLSAAFLELLGQWLGPVGAVERLRDLADIAERQVFDDAGRMC